jgi:hypothetical protein
MTTGDAFTYHCFNCGFKAGWSPGKLLSTNTKKLFSWLGMPETEIQKLGLAALKEQEDIPKAKKPVNFELPEIPLPPNCEKFVNVQGSDPDFIAAVEYVLTRGMSLDWYDWMWSPEQGYRDRVIIPFYHDGKIVGYTGRKITEGKPKYLTHSSAGYIFNLDSQNHRRRYVIVVEGQFDAIAIDGCAIMHNEPNETQIMRLNALAREVIVVPDRDQAGSKMLKAAIDNGWSASMPPWADDVKDVADAVKKYGRLYVLTTILHYKENNQIKIQLMKRKLENVQG